MIFIGLTIPVHPAAIMAQALRAADIRGCIHCFTACGKPFGAVGRGLAVSCGVGINNCRGTGCCGLGTCCAEMGRCCANLCKLMAGCAKVLFVAALILVAAFLAFVFWDSIVSGYGTVRNGTVEFYDKAREDPTVGQVFNKTEEYYGAARDKITEVANAPEVQRAGNKTVELYGVVKDQIVDTFDQIHQSETVQGAINGTVGFFSSLKDKLFG